MSTHLSLKGQPVLGAFLVALGMFMFGIGNAVVKHVDLPVHQILFLRCLFGLPFLMILRPYIAKKNAYTTTKPKLQILRGVIGFSALYGLYYSIDQLPLADATALSFSTPLFITALSMPLLGEIVGLKRWVAVVFGFIGVIVIAKPTGDVNLLGVTAGVVAALLDALVMVISRILSKTDAVFTSVFYHTLISLILLAIMCLFNWSPMNFEQAGFLALLAFVSISGHLAIVKAYSIADAVVVAPMLYTLIIWGLLFGYFVWGEDPGGNLLIGTPIVILSGLYIVWRERKLGVPHIQEKDLV